jgi:hypothetical protein
MKQIILAGELSCQPDKPLDFFLRMKEKPEEKWAAEQAG